MALNGGSETGIADAPDFGGENLGGLGDLGGTNDVFTDLGRSAGSNPHATMGAVLDLPEPPPIAEAPPPPSADEQKVADGFGPGGPTEPALAEAYVGPTGATPIADEARRAQLAEAATVIARAEQDKNSINALLLPPETAQAAQQILDNARDGKAVDFDHLSPTMQGLLKDRLTPEQFNQAIKLPDSKVNDAMYNPNNPRVQVVPPSQPKQFDGASAQPSPVAEPIARFEPGPDDIIDAPRPAEPPPPPPKEPIIIDGKVVSASSSPIVEDDPDRVIPADQMDAAMRQGAVDGKATLDQAPGPARETPGVQYNEDGTIASPASGETQGVDPSRAPVKAEINPNVVDADGYRVLSDDEVTPQQFDSESVADALAAGTLTKEQADAMPDILNKARNGEKVDMSNLSSSQQEIMKRRLTPDQFSSAIRTDANDFMEAARNGGNGAGVEPAPGDAATSGENGSDPAALAAGGEGGDGGSGDGNGTTTEDPGDDEGDDKNNEGDQSKEWTETDEERLDRMTNAQILIKDFDAEVAALSEDEKTKLGEAVINFDQRKELPEDEKMRELVIRGAALHESRLELEDLQTNNPDGAQKLTESVTAKKAEIEAKKAEAAAAEAPENTDETPDENTRIINEIKAEMIAGTMTRKDELLRREGRVKDSERLKVLETQAKEKGPEGMSTSEIIEMNDLREKLKEDPAQRELTQKQIDAIGVKFLEDFMSGKAFDIDPETGESRLTEAAADSLEKINKFQLEKSLQQNGGLSAREAREQAKSILERTSRGERKKLAIETRVREKLQGLMALEMQAMAVPQRLENYRKAKEQLKTQIKKKEAEIGTLKPGEVSTAQKRSELYNMMSRLGSVKAEIARSKNIGRQLNAQYKEQMVSIKRDLKLAGRMATMMAWAESRATDAITAVVMNIDSIHDSE